MALRRWLRKHRISLATTAISACLLVVLGGSAGASYHSAPARTTAVGTRIGSLSIRDAFLPAPASPSVAAIYLTVDNSGSQADALVGVESTAAASSMLMTENSNGSMGMLSELRIPAHGQASLAPGRDHLMLQQPSHTLRMGQHVLVTLHFKRAGYLTISVPVVPLSRILSHG